MQSVIFVHKCQGLVSLAVLLKGFTAAYILRKHRGSPRILSYVICALRFQNGSIPKYPSVPADPY